MNDNSVLYFNQSGFRPKHSTASALLNVTDDWYHAIDKGNLVGMVMLDLKRPSIRLILKSFSLNWIIMVYMVTVLIGFEAILVTEIM